MIQVYPICPYPSLTRFQTELSVELELVDEGGEVADVAHVSGHVVLGARIKVVFAALAGGLQALDLVPQLPPMAVHVLLRGHPGVDVPTELVDQVAKGKESDPLKGHVEEDVDVRLLVSHVHLVPNKAKALGGR